MIAKLPIYDSARHDQVLERNGIVVVRTLNELLQVFAVRAAVYMAEQNCPFHEEFDGNDLCGTHLIAYKNGEPIATIRIRYFGDFVKPERLTVLPAYRSSRIAFTIVKAALAFCQAKGFTRFYGHAQDGVERFWGLFGGEPIQGKQKFHFSDHAYTEMVFTAPAHPDPITTSKSPFLIIAPEGHWDESGVLELSAKRSTHLPKGTNNDEPESLAATI